MPSAGIWLRISKFSRQFVVLGSFKTRVDESVLGLQSPILDIPGIHHNHAHLASSHAPLFKLKSHLLMLITEFALPFV